MRAAELVREYQSKTCRAISSGALRSEVALDVVYQFQDVLRHQSLFFASIRKPRLSEFLVSGNLTLTASEKTCFTTAFPNSNFIFQIPNFLNYIRTDPFFLADIIYNLIKGSEADIAEIVGYSTIPSIFQNGWCFEEDVLWSDFLNGYLMKICKRQRQLEELVSHHFVVFQGFFIQKLCVEYLPMCLYSDLERLNFDKEVETKRVQFTFDGQRLLPIPYITELVTTAQNIMSKLKLHLGRVPISVRKLLYQISKGTLRIDMREWTGIRLASVFFVQCILMPVIKDPCMIGIELREALVFSDLADLFFFCNVPGIKFPPIFVLSVIQKHGLKIFEVDEMVSMLIDSVRMETLTQEFHEGTFARVSPNYKKTTSFLAIDLHYVHKAAFDFNQRGKLCVCGGAMANFDFLLNLPPDIYEEQVYDMITLQLKGYEAESMVELPEPLSISPELEDCFKLALRRIPAVLLQRAEPNDVLEFLMRKEKKSKMKCALKKVVDNIAVFESFVAREIKCLDIEQTAKVELMVSGQLEFNELRIIFQRTLNLHGSLLCTASKVLIDSILDSDLVEFICDFDDEIPVFVSGTRPIHDVAGHITAQVISVMNERVSTFSGDAKLSLDAELILSKTAYCLLIDRISVRRFMSSDDGVMQRVAARISEYKKKLDALHKTSEVNHGLRLADKSRDYLIAGLSTDTFSTVLHFLLKTVQMVLLALGTDDATARRDAITWVIMCSDPEKLICFYYFVTYFFVSHDKLIDIIGGIDISNFTVFQDAVRVIISL